RQSSGCWMLCSNLASLSPASLRQLLWGTTLVRRNGSYQLVPTCGDYLRIKCGPSWRIVEWARSIPNLLGANLGAGGEPPFKRNTHVQKTPTAPSGARLRGS
ncbi:hypothetical protein F443_13313, partial [Phytophthora nicotianae P1569]